MSEALPDTADDTSDDADGELVDDETTESTDARHPLSNDGLAYLLIASVVVAVGLHGHGAIALGSIPQSVVVTWLGMASTATVWAFGGDAASRWFGD